MKVIMTDLKTNLSEEFRNLVQKKLSRFDRVFGDDTVANVKVTAERNSERVEITIHHKGRVYRTENSSDDRNKSLDVALDLLSRKLNKNKTKLEKSLREGIPDLSIEEIKEVESPYSVIKRKTFSIKPMSVEEAILQMNLVGHQFFMFRDQETNEINVVYKRKNGTYGLIEPEE